MRVLDIPAADSVGAGKKAFGNESGRAYVEAFARARLDAFASICEAVYTERLPLAKGLSLAGKTGGKAGVCAIKVRRWGLVAMPDGQPGAYAEIETAIRDPEGRPVHKSVETIRIAIRGDGRPEWESAWITLKLCVEEISERALRAASSRFQEMR